MISILLPILFLGVLCLLLGNIWGRLDWRHVFLRAGALWGAIAILAVELLSLGDAVNTFSLSLVWASLAVGTLGLLLRWIARSKSIRWIKLNLPEGKPLRAWLVIMLAIAGTTALVALFAPPHTWDSLNYHMPRVAHWTQGGSVHHFATGIEIQNSMAPGAEFLVLHFYVLSGGDQLVNFIGWFAMIGSVVGVSYLAGQFGGSLKAQVLSSVVALSLPMGLIQATSTMTDIAVGFWLVVVAVEMMYAWEHGFHWMGAIILSTSAGMSLLTKPTAIPYVAIFAIGSSVVLWQRERTSGIRYVILAVLCVSLLIGPHFIRNLQTYDNIMGREDRVKEHANQLWTASGFLSNLLRNASLHAGTPWEVPNQWLFRLLAGLHFKMGVDPNDPRTTSAGEFRILKPTRSEVLAGNQLHAYLYLVSLVILAIGWKRFPLKTRWMALLVLGAFLLQSVLFKWQIFGGRYHLPFFILMAPVFSVIIVPRSPELLSTILGFILLVSAIPYAVLLESRPLFNWRSDQPVQSILVEDQAILLFGRSKDLYPHYQEVVTKIIDADCNRVGLALGGGAAEYPFWEMLGAPRETLDIEWIVAGSPSSIYRPEDFSACAVICQGCSEDQTTFGPLTRAIANPVLTLYLPGPGG